VTPRLHVMFGGSGAGSLRQALSRAGRDEPVVHHDDSFAFGPINPANVQDRAEWVADKFELDGWAEVSAGFGPVLEASCSAGIIPVAWFSRNDTQSFTGFLEWLWCMGSLPCEVMDTTFQDRPSSISLEKFLDLGLFDRSVPLKDEERASFRALWGKLKSENAPLRILNGDGLVSAPLDVFESLILLHARPDWQKSRVLAGRVLAKWSEDHCYQQGDIFLASRIRVLATSDRLEWVGDLYDIWNCDVRPTT